MRVNRTEYLFSVNTRTPPTMSVDSGEEFTVEVRGAFDDIELLDALPSGSPGSTLPREGGWELAAAIAGCRRVPAFQQHVRFGGMGQGKAGICGDGPSIAPGYMVSFASQPCT
jgi:hypothetical protein